MHRGIHSKTCGDLRSKEMFLKIPVSKHFKRPKKQHKKLLSSVHTTFFL